MFIESLVLQLKGVMRLPRTASVLVFVMLAAMLLVAMLSISPLSNELGRSDRLSWWFS